MAAKEAGLHFVQFWAGVSGAEPGAAPMVYGAETLSMDLEAWELGAPAQLQFWPAHINPTGAAAWDQPRIFETLREAVRAAIAEAPPQAQVAWILTSSGKILKPADVEDLWLQMRAPA